ncbi:MAG: DUF58 domain-containing protein [Chloroflexota bacterium]
MSLAKVILVTAVLLALGLATGFDLLLRVGYVLIGLVVISFLWSLAAIRSLTLERDTRNRRAQVGQTIEERLTVRNDSIVPKLWVEVRDHSTLPGHQISQAVSLAGKASKSWRARTTCKRRGKYLLGPVTIVSGDPFGLFHLQRHVRDTRSVLVYPETVPLPELNIRVGILPGGSTIQHRVQYTTPNVAGIRDYVPGDGFNRIHWPSTARWQKLMVKEFELDPFSDMWILLDMEAKYHHGVGDASSEEYSVKAAASLAHRFLQQNRSVGLAMYGPHRQLVTPDRGARQIWKLLEELAITKATGRMPLAELMAAEATRFGRNTTLVLITPSTSEDWIRALRGVTQSGTRAVVVVVDSASFGGQESLAWIIDSLAGNAVPTFVLRKGDALDRVFVGGDISPISVPVSMQ